jgi:hypothetical protein
MVQSTFQRNGPRKRKSGEMTAEGRRSQIQYKLDHEIRAISPVLLGVEREENWREHFEGVCKSLAPGNEFELDLAYLISWQLWRFGRLIRHETALTTEKIHEPPESMFGREQGGDPRCHCLESENGNGNSRNGEGSKNSLLSRCRALQSGAGDVMFAHEEVREILSLVLEQVRYHNSSEAPKLDGADDEDDRKYTAQVIPLPSRHPVPSKTSSSCLSTTKNSGGPTR